MIPERRVVEILTAQAEALVGRPAALQTVNLSPEERVQLAPYFQLAERLARSMPPVQPSAAFRRSLKREVVEAAKQRAVRTQRVRRSVLIGAAAIGSVLSLASLVTVVVMTTRARARARTLPAR